MNGLVTKSCLTLGNPMDYSPPGSSVHGILQERILEWVAIPFSRGSFQPRDQTQVSCTAGGFLTFWATRKASGPLYPRAFFHVCLWLNQLWPGQTSGCLCHPADCSHTGLMSSEAQAWNSMMILPWTFSFNPRCPLHLYNDVIITSLHTITVTSLS